MVQPLSRLIELDEQETVRQQERVAFLNLTSAVLEMLPDGLVVVDAHGIMQLVNQRTEEIFGYHRSELLGQAIEKLLPPEARERHAQNRHDYNRYTIDTRMRGMGLGSQLRGRRSDGTTFPADITLARMIVPGAIFNLALIRNVLPSGARPATSPPAPIEGRNGLEPVI